MAQTKCYWFWEMLNPGSLTETRWSQLHGMNLQLHWAHIPHRWGRTHTYNTCITWIPLYTHGSHTDQLKLSICKHNSTEVHKQPFLAGHGKGPLVGNTCVDLHTHTMWILQCETGLWLSGWPITGLDPQVSLTAALQAAVALCWSHSSCSAQMPSQSSHAHRTESLTQEKRN